MPIFHSVFFMLYRGILSKALTKPRATVAAKKMEWREEKKKKTPQEKCFARYKAGHRHSCETAGCKAQFIEPRLKRETTGIEKESHGERKKKLKKNYSTAPSRKTPYGMHPVMIVTSRVHS
jgi:hypothetical protein